MLGKTAAEARVSNLEIGLRTLEGRVWTLLFVVGTLVGGLYFFIDIKTTVINDKISTLELTMKDVATDQKIIRKDIEVMKKDIEAIHEKLDALLKK